MIFLINLLIADDRYAFIYSKNIDDTFINFYDKVIVEADLIDNTYAINYPDKMVAYISIGEIEPWRDKRYKKSWIISKNTTWNSLVADLGNKSYQEFILNRAEKLYSMGYRNFFLDTVDTYNRLKDRYRREKVKRGTIKLIKKLRKEYPKAKIIINRGFEILDKVYQDVDAVVAESLIAGYNHSKKRYIKVPKKDREWLLNSFNRAKRLGLDVISIDYSNKKSNYKIEIAKKIRALGIIPYVTDGLLQIQGESDIKREKRNILILFNKSILKDKDSFYSNAHRILSMPIEHLGYIPILYDISTGKLPKNIEDRFHGVIIWSGGETKNDKYILNWTRDVIKSGLKVLFIDNFIFDRDNNNLKFFGLGVEKNRNSLFSKSETVYTKPFYAYEIKASIEDREDILVKKSKNIEPIIYLNYENAQKYIAVGTAPWGGYAEKNSILLTIGDRYFWTIDPFQFLKKTLNLNLKLIPDPTTEGGRRELFIDVNGDKLSKDSKVKDRNIASKTLIDKISKENPLKSLVSPFGIQRGGYWKIYINRDNRNIISCNYKDIVEKLKLTENPERLKPIYISYYLYSGSRPSCIEGLNRLYKWAISQKTTKIFISDYIKKIQGFYKTSIAKISNKTYEIRNSGELRTLRVDNKIFIDIEGSTGVAGFNYTKDKTYITLYKRDRHIIKISNNRPKTPYLIEVNGWVERYKKNQFNLKSYTKLDAIFYLPKECYLSKAPKWIDKKIYKDKIHIYSTKTIGGATVEFKCK